MKLLPGSLSSEHLASSLWAVEHGAESEVPGIWYRGIGTFAWYGNRFAVYNIYTHTPWTCVPDLHCTGGAGGSSMVPLCLFFEVLTILEIWRILKILSGFPRFWKGILRIFHEFSLKIEEFRDLGRFSVRQQARSLWISLKSYWFLLNSIEIYWISLIFIDF